jgi:hypothetical protein
VGASWSAGTETDSEEDSSGARSAPGGEVTNAANGGVALDVDEEWPDTAEEAEAVEGALNELKVSCGCTHGVRRPAVTDTTGQADPLPRVVTAPG